MHAMILALNEDDRQSAQVAESLKKSGHTVIHCKNYPAAIAVLKERHVDIIISDVHLQNGGNVFDFVRWVKKNPSTKDTLFVMFSAEPTSMAKVVEDGLRTSARLMGVAMYITMEDFDSDAFRKKIDSLLPPDDQTITNN